MLKDWIITVIDLTIELKIIFYLSKVEISLNKQIFKPCK
jgi:hypothetical protein